MFWSCPAINDRRPSSAVGDYRRLRGRSEPTTRVFSKKVVIFGVEMQPECARQRHTTRPGIGPAHPDFPRGRGGMQRRNFGVRRIVVLVPRANLGTKTRLIKNTSLISDPGEAAETALALPAGPIFECPLALPLREGHSRVSRTNFRGYSRPTCAEGRVSGTKTGLNAQV